MQITSVTPSLLSFAPARTTSSPVDTQGSDQLVSNISPDTFSSFVQEAKAQPEVRQDVVDSFKARIASGHYPPQDIIEGLTNLLGAGIHQLATQSASKN